MSTARVGTLIWVLIYGGLFGVCTGVALRNDGQTLGWGFLVGGIVAVLLGAVLVWVRSRMNAPVGG